MKLKVNSFEISNQIEFGHNNKMDLVSNIKIDMINSIHHYCSDMESYLSSTIVTEVVFKIKLYHRKHLFKNVRQKKYFLNIFEVNVVQIPDK